MQRVEYRVDRIAQNRKLEMQNKVQGCLLADYRIVKINLDPIGPGVRVDTRVSYHKLLRFDLTDGFVPESEP